MAMKTQMQLCFRPSTTNISGYVNTDTLYIALVIAGDWYKHNNINVATDVEFLNENCL